MQEITGLRPGVALFEVPGRGNALRTASGRLVGVDLPGSAVAALDAWFADPGGARPDGLDGEIAAFAAAGHLRSTGPAPTVRVAVLGTGPLADAVAAVLAGPGTVPAPVSGADAVCAVGDGPAPEAWTAHDDLPGRGVAWFRLSVEGRHGIIEPPAVVPGDAGHADVRARRLAAAGSAHPHLAAYWAATAGQAGAGERELLAALLAADVRAWARGDTHPAAGDLVPAALPARRRLRVVDLDTGAIADHPLLPVPEQAP
ncbi:hypothetical protein [Pseudonocardia phyllosphaerae]|uniref:hypothetical protein n=1 Tax=Pseudonocardia phyllosphaerae TaxID=3390502 RepID=UPI00397DF4DA